MTRTKTKSVDIRRRIEARRFLLTTYGEGVSYSKYLGRIFKDRDFHIDDKN
jgi:hypothetical protein